MAPRFSRPRLIDMSDRQYRAHLAQIMMTKDNHRPTRPPRARDLFGGEVEVALRTWLSARHTLSERRIIEYLEHRGRSAIKKYRELDAVITDGSTIQIFEIKASERASSLRRAARQLRDSRTLLAMLFRSVSATIMLVDTGIPKTADDIAAIMAEEDAPFEPPPTLDEVLAILPDVQPIAALNAPVSAPTMIGLLQFSVDQIIAIAGAENLHLDWDEDDLDDLEPDDADAGAETDANAAEDDNAPDAGGTFAEALRRAQEQQGKQRK